MQLINSSTGLRAAILQLESQRTEEGKVMKEQFHLAFESIKPINLIKSTFREVAESRDLSDNIVGVATGLAVGYLSKKLFEKVSHNPLKKLLGTVLMYGITNLVAKHPETVQSVGNGILNLIRWLPSAGVHGSEKNGVEEVRYPQLK